VDDAKTEAKIETQNAATTMARSMSTREQWLVKQRMAVLRNNHILTFGKVFKTSLTSWNALSFFSYFVAHG